jgi:hypothetical protein
MNENGLMILIISMLGLNTIKELEKTLVYRIKMSGTLMRQDFVSKCSRRGIASSFVRWPDSERPIVVFGSKSSFKIELLKMPLSSQNDKWFN